MPLVTVTPGKLILPMASSTGSNKRRKTVAAAAAPDNTTLQISDLPDTVLAGVSQFLAKPSRAIFAAAMTASSSSWRRANWQRLPSSSSKAILSISPTQNDRLQEQEQQQHEKQWEVLDFVDVEKTLAGNLTDNDLGAIFVCIDAVNKLKTLKLTGCSNNIVGTGLEPLRGSIVLEQIDLSTIGQREKSSVGGSVLVLPILESILNAPQSSLNHIQLPKRWHGNLGHNLISRLGKCKGCEAILRGEASIRCSGCMRLICQNCIENSISDDRCHRCEELYILLVIDMESCSRDEAVEALKANDWDLVDASMSMNP